MKTVKELRTNLKNALRRVDNQRETNPAGEFCLLLKQLLTSRHYKNEIQTIVRHIELKDRELESKPDWFANFMDNKKFRISQADFLKNTKVPFPGYLDALYLLYAISLLKKVPLNKLIEVLNLRLSNQFQLIKHFDLDSKYNYISKINLIGQASQSPVVSDQFEDHEGLLELLNINKQERELIESFIQEMHDDQVISTNSIIQGVCVSPFYLNILKTRTKNYIDLWLNITETSTFSIDSYTSFFELSGIIDGIWNDNKRTRLFLELKNESKFHELQHKLSSFIRNKILEHLHKNRQQEPSDERVSVWKSTIDQALNKMTNIISKSLFDKVQVSFYFNYSSSSASHQCALKTIFNIIAPVILEISTISPQTIQDLTTELTNLYEKNLRYPLDREAKAELLSMVIFEVNASHFSFYPQDLYDLFEDYFNDSHRYQHLNNIVISSFERLKGNENLLITLQNQLIASLKKDISLVKKVDLYDLSNS
ncbi:hypothetical protein M899_2470 [Bacteriovorax sp. BSW11_IV]|uniref:hypothetical protein n=1 Tax=Bacteriovorax sp. BSW11_IV TaxID=1353529 RepID=UPI00038A15FD|nr:hypothetical protein [Bacteriovorax sp. BSW11_IV]EQC44520.1 hypothetical protein M899_2470 [Bacteriovorax sp. BSW11_IV]